MKNCYIIRLSSYRIAIADLTDYYNEGMMLTRINVPKEFRNIKYGTELLGAILTDADKDKVTLFLEISPSDGLDYDQLERWYLNHGFKHWKGIYRRKPKGE